MCHIWQHQRGICLPLARHPFCRYHYAIRPGWRLERYGIEQQAEIVRHAYLLRRGDAVPGKPTYLIFGQIRRYKNVTGLMQDFAETGTDAQLVIAGEIRGTEEFREE
ncbi:hypothetical protein LTR94_035032, partial [Friedmanniomyces endolithicus]